MSGFNVDVDAAISSLRALLGETTHQHERHKAAQPSYPPAAAGRDFGAFGVEVATMFEALHRGVDKRLEAMETTTDAATRQVGIYADTDRAFAGDVGAVDGGQQ